MPKTSVTVAAAIAIFCGAWGTSSALEAGTSAAAIGGGDAPKRIGVFLAVDGSAGIDGREIQRGTELAARECSGTGGQCQLVAAAGAGKWDAGAGELVRLVYEEALPAVLGPTDSRTAHLVEQVAARAKGQFILLTPWASDPSLTRIGVPWFFRLVPDDLSQARAVFTAIERACGSSQAVAVVQRSDFDSRVALDAFEKVAAAYGALAFHKIFASQGEANLDRVVAQLRTAGPDAVLFLQPPVEAAQAARRLRAEGITALFLGPLRLASPAFLDAAGSAAEGMIIVSPPRSNTPAATRFRARYRAEYGREPSAPAAYGYDAATVLFHALQSSGDRRESVQVALAATSLDGVTGRIEFDTKGNLLGSPHLSRVEHGRLGSTFIANLDRCRQTGKLVTSMKSGDDDGW